MPVSEALVQNWVKNWACSLIEQVPSHWQTATQPKSWEWGKLYKNYMWHDGIAAVILFFFVYKEICIIFLCIMIVNCLFHTMPDYFGNPALLPQSCPFWIPSPLFLSRTPLFPLPTLTDLLIILKQVWEKVRVEGESPGTVSGKFFILILKNVFLLNKKGKAK